MIPDNLRQNLGFINTLEGWCTPEKANAIAEIVLENNPRVCVELGVFGARSLVVFGMALREAGLDGRVWGIDPWTPSAALEGEENTPNGKWWADLDHEAIRDGAMSAITRSVLWHWVKVIVSKSEEAASLFSDIDVLHIDGNHSEKVALRDATLWLPKVKSGGIVIFDDVDWPSTQTALAHMKEHCDVLRDVGNCRIYRKK